MGLDGRVGLERGRGVVPDRNRGQMGAGRWARQKRGPDGGPGDPYLAPIPYWVPNPYLIPTPFLVPHPPILYPIFPILYPIPYLIPHPLSSTSSLIWYPSHPIPSPSDISFPYLVPHPPIWYPIPDWEYPYINELPKWNYSLLDIS